MESISGLTPPVTSLPLGNLESNLASIVSLPEAPAETPMRVKQFRSYQMRLPVTAACLLSGLTLTLLSMPLVKPGSALNLSLLAAGYCLIVLGIAIRIWSIAYINSRKSVSVVTTGPYALCRNPLYLGTFLIVVAYLLMVQSLTLAAFTIPVILLYLWGVIPAEETVLRSRHPREYDAYCAAVPRWLPKFKRAAFERSKLVWCPAVRREVECAGWWIGIALAVHIVCSYRLAGWWIHPLNWP
ncbi:methyltransferase family protein [Planctomicrobium sp. SH661]|uniref:methyltransferase family protein n=1 Tax=Planctomicrobium sp. SH661 TaxID=3448124 RepID=UPI003F5C1629